MNLALRIGIALTVLAAAVGLGVRAAGAGAVVRCGVVSAVTPATATEAGSFVLTTSETTVKVVAPAEVATPDASAYTCVSVVPGSPAAQLTGIVPAGAPGYIAPPATTTAATFREAATSLVLLTTALVFFAILVVFASYGGAWGRRVVPRGVRTYNEDIRQRPGGVRASHR